MLSTLRVLADPSEAREEIVDTVLRAYEVGRQDGAQESGWGPADDRSSEFTIEAHALCRALGL